MCDVFSHRTAMIDALALLKSRRSVPPAFLKEPGPDPRQLETLLTVAARVPDHGKLQPWRFILYEGAARDKASRIVSEAFLSRNPNADDVARRKEGTRFSLAPLVVGVVSTAGEHPKIPIWEQQLSAAAVCENMVIAAAAMGFGASWLTGWYAYDDEVLARLGLRPGERIAGFVHVGSASEVVPDRPRPEIESITTRFA
jgi:nitroreductase